MENEMLLQLKFDTRKHSIFITFMKTMFGSLELSIMLLKIILLFHEKSFMLMIVSNPCMFNSFDFQNRFLSNTHTFFLFNSFLKQNLVCALKIS